MSSAHLSMHRSGLTLIEILVGIFILMLVGGAVWAFQTDVFSLQSTLTQDLGIQGEARKVFATASAQIRSAAPSSTGAYALAQATAASLTFYSNIDGDAPIERVRYFLDGTTLKKGILKPTGAPLAYDPTDEVVTDVLHDMRNGATPVFTYYDATYDGTTDPLTEPVDIPSVRLIKIVAMIDHDPSRPPDARTIATQVMMRNMKDNF
ncbi:MAG: prepilin-type N-terminal cleavage/methylation domain-containing protein [Candidatus Kerfeldbacteria bacterium]|nr:prepilin-type N-terminal cleavage/methylation domain-containing protein [Candidatus Kerfeldbacteria bacterium]